MVGILERVVVSCSGDVVYICREEELGTARRNNVSHIGSGSELQQWSKNTTMSRPRPSSTKAKGKKKAAKNGFNSASPFQWEAISSTLANGNAAD